MAFINAEEVINTKYDFLMNVNCFKQQCRHDLECAGDFNNLGLYSPWLSQPDSPFWVSILSELERFCTSFLSSPHKCVVYNGLAKVQPVTSLIGAVFFVERQLGLGQFSDQMAQWIVWIQPKVSIN